MNTSEPSEDNTEVDTGEVDGPTMTFAQFTEQTVAPLVNGGAFTVSLPNQPPYLMMESETPSGMAICLFGSRSAVEQFVRQHGELLHESESGALDVYSWAAEQLPHLLNCAVAVSEVDVTVQADTDLPELIDPAVLMRTLAAAGYPMPQTEELYPTPRMELSVARSRGGLQFSNKT